MKHTLILISIIASIFFVSCASTSFNYDNYYVDFPAQQYVQVRTEDWKVFKMLSTQVVTNDLEATQLVARLIDNNTKPIYGSKHKLTNHNSSKANANTTVKKTPVPVYEPNKYSDMKCFTEVEMWQTKYQWDKRYNEISFFVQAYADGERAYSGTFSILVYKDSTLFKTLIDKGAQITPRS